jgi:hypothetical protein
MAKRSGSLLLLSLLLGGSGLVPANGARRADAPGHDPFGGWAGLSGRRTGYFHTQKIGGQWWFVTPVGNAFFSKGVCAVSFGGDSIGRTPDRPYQRVVTRKYGTAQRWAAAMSWRLRSWGLNTSGAWSSAEMQTARVPYALMLDLAASTVPDLWLEGGISDVYSPSFRAKLGQTAQRLCTPRRRDPWLLGYFTDNELRWGPDWRSRESLLESYLKLPRDAPGRRHAVAFVRQHGRSGQALTEAEKSLFQEQVARQYAWICHDAIRRCDRHHLILGCRFASAAPLPVLRAIRGSVDVVSLNNYDHQAPVSLCRSITAVTGRPVMITEFSFRAMDSGLPNTKGAGAPVATQKDRAYLFDRYVNALVDLPNCIGYHWFEWCDQPKQGRFDGENSNYGLVNIDDTPWKALVARVQKVNSGLEQRRAGRRPGRKGKAGRAAE